MFRRLLSLQLLSYYNSIRKTFGAKQDSLAQVCFCYSFAKMLPSDPSLWQIQFQYLHKSDFFSHPPANLQPPRLGVRAWVVPSGRDSPAPVPSRRCRDRWLPATRGAMLQVSGGEGAPRQALRGCSHLPKSPGSDKRNPSPTSSANIHIHQIYGLFIRCPNSEGAAGRQAGISQPVYYYTQEQTALASLAPMPALSLLQGQDGVINGQAGLEQL